MRVEALFAWGEAATDGKAVAKDRDLEEGDAIVICWCEI